MKGLRSIQRAATFLSPRQGAWIGQAIALIVLFFLIVPARRIWHPNYAFFSGGYSDGSASVLSHGWPWWFIQRDESGTAWKIGTDIVEYRPTALACDIFVAVVCLAFAAPLWRASHSYRRRLFHFGIRTLLIYVTVIAVVLAAWAANYRKLTRATEAIAESYGSSGEMESLMPLWLTEITESEIWERMGLAGYRQIEFVMPKTSKDFECLKCLAALYPEAVELSIDLDRLPDAIHRLSEVPSIQKLQALSGSPAVKSLAFLDSLPHLRRLDISISSHDDFLHIACLHELQELVIDGGVDDEYQTCDDDLECISSLSTLRSLGIQNSQITGEGGIAHLRNLKKLEELAVDASLVDDAAFPYLTELPRLKVLILKETNVTGAGIEQLARCKRLQTIRIVGAPLRDAGAAGLRLLRSLRCLDLDNTMVTEAILAELSTLPNLEMLSIRSADLQNLQAFDRNGFPRLRALSLYSSNVSDEARAQLAAARPGLSIDELWNRPSPNDSSFRMEGDRGYLEIGPQAESPEQVTKLVPSKKFVDYLYLNVRDADKWVDWIARLPNLTALNLGVSPVTDVQLERLVAACNHLTELDISETVVTTEGLQLVASLQELERLEVNPSHIPNVVAVVRQLPNLKQLSVDSDYTRLNKKEWQAVGRRLERAFPNLEIHPRVDD